MGVDLAGVGGQFAIDPVHRIFIGAQVDGYGFAGDGDAECECVIDRVTEAGAFRIYRNLIVSMDIEPQLSPTVSNHEGVVLVKTVCRPRNRPEAG